jgi:mannitol/fructose-specific phosphotransferase system IIA component (Ntr-type)
VNLGRWLAEERVDLDLDAAFGDEYPATVESVAQHMAALLETSPDVVNATKLRSDLVLRERRAPSLPGHGVAIPHVRTLQARRLVLAVGISRTGLALPAPDGERVRLVIALVGPPYDDKAYLAAYKSLGERLERPGWIEAVCASRARGEVVRALAGE